MRTTNAATLMLMSVFALSTTCSAALCNPVSGLGFDHNSDAHRTTCSTTPKCPQCKAANVCQELATDEMCMRECAEQGCKKDCGNGCHWCVLNMEFRHFKPSSTSNYYQVSDHQNDDTIDWYCTPYITTHQCAVGYNDCLCCWYNGHWQNNYCDGPI